MDKPSFGDYKYLGLDLKDTQREYDRDMMMWEQTEALKKIANQTNDSNSEYSNYTNYSEPVYKSNLTYYSVMLIALNRVIAFIAVFIMMIIVRINNYCILAIVVSLTINIILRICIPIFESNAEKKQNVEVTKKDKKVNKGLKKKRTENSHLTIAFNDDKDNNISTEFKNNTKRTSAPEYIEGNLFKTVNNDDEKSIMESRTEETTEDELDPLLIYAIKEIVESGEASTAFLQRKLKIGYARAGRIIDQLEEKKMITGYEGSKPRQILISKEEVNKLIK